MGSKVEYDAARLAQLFHAGVRLSEIAAHLGMSLRTCQTIASRHGLRRRRECIAPRKRQAPEPLYEPTPEEDAESSDSLRLSPWVAKRIQELKLGMPV